MPRQLQRLDLSKPDLGWHAANSAWSARWFHSGIDRDKRTSVITTLTASGKPVAQVMLPNHQFLLRQYFAQSKSASVANI
jgi:hypothetical protein